MSQYNEKDSRDMEACGWDDDFWEEIGLGDLVDGHHAKIGLNELNVIFFLFFWEFELMKYIQFPNLQLGILRAEIPFTELELFFPLYP